MSSDELFPALFLSFPGKFNCLSPARHCVGHIAGIRSPENLNHLRSSSPSAIHALDDLWRRLSMRHHRPVDHRPRMWPPRPLTRPGSSWSVVRYQAVCCSIDPAFHHDTLAGWLVDAAGAAVRGALPVGALLDRRHNLPAPHTTRRTVPGSPAVVVYGTQLVHGRQEFRSPLSVPFPQNPRDACYPPPLAENSFLLRRGSYCCYRSAPREVQVR